MKIHEKGEGTEEMKVHERNCGSKEGRSFMRKIQVHERDRG